MQTKPWFLFEQADAFDFVRRIPDRSVDLIITDPAYESLEKHRAIGTTTRLTTRWFPVLTNQRLAELPLELWRVLRVNAHCYLLSDQETAFDVLVPTMKQAGFTFWKALIWNKETMGMGYHYRAQHEFVLFFEKGERKLNDLGISDVLPFKRVRGYPTEKPEGLARLLVEQSSSPGEVVLDMFVGSGAIGAAALSVNRNFMGCELLEDAAVDAQDRLLAAGGMPVSKRPRPALELVAR